MIQNEKKELLSFYWFEEKGKTVTINAECYRKVIEQFNDNLNAIFILD